MCINETISMDTVRDVLNRGSDFVVSSKEEFNKGIDHIFGLIKDSFLLYENGSYPSSYYLSIIIIEEVAKLHMGLFVPPCVPGTNRKHDKLYDHKTKDIIGCNFTVSLGDRLKNAIGLPAIEKICNEAYNGDLKSKREQAFYFSHQNGRLVFPCELYSKEETKNILLFAIESFDDNLMGYTDYSLEKSSETDCIFNKICLDE